ncbi:hypothetical protein IEO21_04504 [Rhodonia placenta]|uniref:IRG-type G domain-containing protein n=1 Tax=Rhodonia placenta TaxID=104341 RepID=A0A8H7U364_9APHY|nr:hypothetical protein IEO21_04504 [Postia placenta]
MSKTSPPTDGIPAAPYVGLLGRLPFIPIAVARFVYTLYMFTHSDMQTIMLPITSFSYISVPSTSVGRMAQAVLWTWLHLLQCCVSNQIYSIPEDKDNKPWRPLPAGRITVQRAKYLRWTLLVICFALSGHYGVFEAGAVFTVATLLYNEGGLDSHWETRNLLNALAYAAFDTGASSVARLDRDPALSTIITSAQWYSILIILTTIHASDFRDEVGDRLQKRRTIPVVMPGLGRLSMPIGLIAWSYAVFALPGCPTSLSSAMLVLGTIVGTRFYYLKDAPADRTSYLLYCKLYSFATMGQVIAPFMIAGALFTTVSGFIRSLQGDSESGNIGPNPVMEELERRIEEERQRADEADNERQRAEEQQRAAEEASARAAEDARRAEEERERADEARARAEEDAKQAEENRRIAEEEQRRAEEHRRRADEERRAAEEARQRAEENARRVEEARNLADGARQTAEDNARRADEDKRRAEEQKLRAEEEKRIADEAKAAAEEQRRQAEEDRQRSEALRRRADKDARRAKAEQEKAEIARAVADKAAAEAKAAAEEAHKALKDGIKPVIMPTRGEYEAAKKRLQYKDGIFHFAIAGISGSGKSSLINAFRGLRNGSRNSLVAKTGVTETTSQIARYADPNKANPFVWYDVPGAGTLSIPDWVYFNEQGLYIFDCIIVLTDNRFMQTDEAILRNCARFQIPSYIVRSKSLQHVQNILNDTPYDEDEDEDEDVRMEKAIKHYVAETRYSVAQNLEKAGLPQQRVYVVDKESLVQVACGKEPKTLLDELELVKDLLAEAQRRRVRRPVFKPEASDPVASSSSTVL